MNKKIIAFLSVCLAVSACGYADENASSASADNRSVQVMKAEGLIDSYSLSCSCDSYAFYITANTSGSGKMAEIGLKNIILEQSEDGMLWHEYKALPDDLLENASVYSLARDAYKVEEGYFYRVRATHFAVEDAVFPRTQEVPNVSAAVYMAGTNDPASYHPIAAPNVTSADDLKELYALAAKADADYLALPYIKGIVNDPEGKTTYRDDSYDLAAMEVLVNNKRLTADALQNGAGKLKDASDSTELRQNIAAQCGKLVDRRLYTYMVKSRSAADKVAELLKTARAAQENNEYFLIMYYGISQNFSPDMSNAAPENLGSHAVVGMGITDGSWTFGGRTYDKCILTLDAVNTADKGSPFSADTCIFVDSAANELYIPAYSDKAETDIHVIAVDCDTLVNCDTSDIFNIRVFDGTHRGAYSITTEKDGVETVRNNDNDYLDHYENGVKREFFVKADKLKIDRTSISYGGDAVCFSNGKFTVETELSAGKGTVEYDGRIFRINGTYDHDRIHPVGEEVHDHFMYSTPELSLGFGGKIGEGFFFEPRENSFILGEKGRSSSLAFSVNNTVSCFIFTSQPTEVRYGTSGVTGFYIDRDGDGKFEHKAEVGDVNCDGLIDASDASCVLVDYSARSTGNMPILNDHLADLNNDGLVDASDASEILQKYAELSTEK